MTLGLLEYSWDIYFEYWFMGPRGHFYSGMSLAILDKQVFRGLTGSQQTPRIGGVTVWYQS